jgi:hypothetical protein
MKISYFYLLQDEKHILVGGSNHIEKYESMGRIIPYIMENVNCSKPPASII